MWESGTPFGDLVREAVAESTYRELAGKAIDPRTGYRTSHQTLWKIAHDEPVKINPPLVRAVAAAVRKPEHLAQIAAAQQYVGLVAGDPLGASTPEAAVVVAHVPGIKPEHMPLVHDLLKRWASGDAPEAEAERVDPPGG
ncbi:hypothetical protein RKE29_02700 [Streptomyces sp. B1866]|uniref:hypothetical protein n=1 Tax=Streptomyces sp. B1866 TaxID=3075431 RepID=UPI002890B157|nr:hypothetical protein [Streptomyces sp. B1866]MDT3395568.1 hypothetical protein [Streptomyces sp. B1866]